MADTERTEAELLAIFADGQPQGSIDPQDMRDYVKTTDVVNTRFSTGLITGGEITINGGDNTKVDIAAGQGTFVDNFTDPQNPVRVKVSWTAFVAEDVPNLATQPATFFGLDLSSGTALVVSRAQLFTAEERRDFVSLAVAVHFGGTVVESIGPLYTWALDGRQTVEDLAEAIGPINLAGGNVYSPNAGANLTMDKSAGSTVFIGATYNTSKKAPNNTIDPAQSPVPAFFYTFQDGSGGFTNTAVTNTINPEQWDNGTGTLATVGNNQFAIQRIWFFPLLNLTAIHYPQATYGTMALAQAALNTELFNKNPILISGFRSWLIVEKGTLDLTDTADALFTSAGRFGDVFRE